ncbi:MAG: 4-alpha-glucanotransferase [Lachnospiraceae bacterium]|nr:4-alpha-glucanotransferase [Lachnospiraceae bacterium]
MRGCGILFPIFSLSSKYGIGCFSREAYEFVDFLERSGQGYWQILPVGPTGFGDSPYQPFSAFAGNPYFISPEILLEEGLLKPEDLEGYDFGSNPERVDYGAIYNSRFFILKAAYRRFRRDILREKPVVSEKKQKTPILTERESEYKVTLVDGALVQTRNEAFGDSNSLKDESPLQDGAPLENNMAGKTGQTQNKATDEETSPSKNSSSFEDIIMEEAAPETEFTREMKADYLNFLKEQDYWLTDYALFMALKEDQGGKPWQDWDEDYRRREEKAMSLAKKEFADSIDFYRFIQYEFQRQWKKLRDYANGKKVKIIGDLPFYASADSADAWAHPEVFQMDENLRPKAVAGCPPDAFSCDGQLWGNPVYDWEGLKKDGYSWWIRRMQRNYQFYDVIRFDHFHGFAEYYAIPYGDSNARNGEQKAGPGMDLFRAMEEKIGHLNVIAEDLGTNTPENEKLLADSGFPGMKVLQYAFTSWDSYYMNHKHIQNCVVYTGTHDNTPTRAWIEEINDGERYFARRYINSMNTDYNGFVWDMIREAYRSVANLCIIPLQDYLCKGKEARINFPGTQDNNWQWRLAPNYLSEDLSRSIRDLSELYGRMPR